MAAPDLYQRFCAFVQKEGTDDLTANLVGQPFSRLTIARALLDLADSTRYPPASATAPHLVSVGPGDFTLAATQWPPFTYLRGSCDGEGNPNTTITLTGNLTLAAAWSANTAQSAAFGDVTIVASGGAIDFTMPAPTSGNPARTISLQNIRQNVTLINWEATSTADALRIESMVGTQAAGLGLVMVSGTVTLNNVVCAGAITLRDKTSFAAAGQFQGVISVLGLTVQSVAAAGCVAQLKYSNPGFFTIAETAPGVVAVQSDVASLPTRANITLTGSAALTDITYLSDAQGEGYTPTTPANWAVVPVNVQQALDTIAAGGAGTGLPPQATHAGELLTTNGSVASWTASIANFTFSNLLNLSSTGGTVNTGLRFRGDTYFYSPSQGMLALDANGVGASAALVITDSLTATSSFVRTINTGASGRSFAFGTSGSTNLTIPLRSKWWVFDSTAGFPMVIADGPNGWTFYANNAIALTISPTTITAALSITPSQTLGIVGTTTNNNANAGSVGEVVTSSVASGAAVALASGTTSNVTSISLTAGDWDVSGNVNFSLAAATVTQMSAGITDVSATVPTDGSESYSGLQLTVGTTIDTATMRFRRISLAATTTVYLVGRATFSVGAISAFGSIVARRRR